MRNYYCRMARMAGVASMACAAFFMAASPALARSGHFKTVQVQILYPSQIGNGTQLKPGSYRVEVAENTKSPEVMFYRRNKLVAETQGRLVDTGKKNSQTELDYNTGAGNQHVLTQLELRGWTGNVVFNSSNAASSGS